MYNIIHDYLVYSVNLTWIVQYNIRIFQKKNCLYLFMEGRIEQPQLYREVEIKVLMSTSDKVRNWCMQDYTCMNESV